MYYDEEGKFHFDEMHEFEMDSEKEEIYFKHGDEMLSWEDYIKKISNDHDESQRKQKYIKMVKLRKGEARCVLCSHIMSAGVKKEALNANQNLVCSICGSILHWDRLRQEFLWMRIKH